MIKAAHATAPGKIILFGEHSVVYGKPALVTAIDKRAHIEVERHPNTPRKIRISTMDYRSSHEIPFSTAPTFITDQPTHIQPLLRIIQSIYVQEEIEESITVKVASDIPRSAGLGSSASVCVALTAALADLFDLGYSLEQISACAFKGEQLVHGTPSGIDNTVSTFGGCIRYHKGEIEPIEGSLIQLIIGNTGIARETKTWVGKVRSRYDTFPNVIEPVINAMGDLAKEAERVLATRDLVRLGELIDINHGMLSSIGVSIAELDHLVNQARSAGAYGAKLTGAGGGGCMFALVDDENHDKVFRALHESGAGPIRAQFETEGVLIH
ncbi:MAG: mevalonate kinase [Candidatus Heimdallarchaeota archaeon]